jgi:hypothetical protein
VIVHAGLAFHDFEIGIGKKKIRGQNTDGGGNDADENAFHEFSVTDSMALRKHMLKAAACRLQQRRIH